MTPQQSWNAVSLPSVSPPPPPPKTSGIQTVGSQSISSLTHALTVTSSTNCYWHITEFPYSSPTQNSSHFFSLVITLLPLCTSHISYLRCLCVYINTLWCTLEIAHFKLRSFDTISQSMTLSCHFPAAPEGLHDICGSGDYWFRWLWIH